MKKSLLLAVISIVFAFNSNAQEIEKGTLQSLKGQKKVNFVVDYSKTSFNGKNEKSFSEYETDWYKDKTEVISYIIDGVLKEVKDYILIGEYPDAEYTLTLYPDLIERKGDTEAHAELTDKSGNVLCVIEDIEGEGGTFGTKLNLIKDGSKEIGANFGKFLKKQLRKLK